MRFLTRKLLVIPPILLGFVILAVRLAGGQNYPGLTPEQMQQIAEMGIDPTLFAIPGVICGAAMGAGVAAIGGAILSAIKPD